MFSDDDIDLDDTDSDIVTYFSHVMAIDTIGLNNINLDDDNFDDSAFIIYVRLMAWCNKFKPYVTCKKR